MKQKIESGELTFAAAASQFSTCPSKGKGGDLGIFSSLSRIAFLPYEDKDIKAFDAVAFSAPVGDVTTVTTSFGTHLIKVEGRNS